MPNLCVFSPFSCTFPSQTKSILHILFKIISNSSYIIKYTQSSFNTYLSSRSFMIFSQNNSNMGHNPYKYQTHKFIRVCSNPTPFTLQLNRKSNLKGRTPCFSCTFGVLPTTPQQIWGLGDLFHKTLDKGGPFSKTKP